MLEAMRRSTTSRPTITLARLLEAQPQAIRKDPRFPLLVSMLRASSRLRSSLLNRTAYALLNKPILEKRNLANFLQTYRLPARPPFFELFLSMKWEERARCAARRREREERIAVLAAAFPPGVRALISYLAEAERLSRPSAPYWNKELRPSTLKRAREMAGYGMDEWLSFFDEYIERLRSAYRRIALLDTEMLLACMVLECAPDPKTGRQPSKTALSMQFKRLSKLHHPDRGGDPRLFRLLVQARDRLLDCDRARTPS